MQPLTTIALDRGERQEAFWTPGTLVDREVGRMARGLIEAVLEEQQRLALQAD